MLNITGPDSRPLLVDEAIGQIEELRGEVWINGASIDLRQSDLGGEPWKAIGVNIMECSGAQVWFGWAHPKALGWHPGAFQITKSWRPDMGRGSGPGVVLCYGDRVTLGEPVFSVVNDAALEDFDRRRATAAVVVRRANGLLEQGPERITLADPVFMDSGVGGMLVSADMQTMRARLAKLRNVAGRRGVAGGGRLLSAIEEAERHLWTLDKLAAELAQLSATELGERWTWSTVTKSQNAAVAFGFAVGRAESELENRPAKRLRPKSQKDVSNTATYNRKRKAEEWHERAKPILADLRAKHENWSGTNFGREIYKKLAKPKPRTSQIARWVRAMLKEGTPRV